MVARGDDATAVALGTFVSVEGHVVDGTCYQCLTGNAHICENVSIVGVDRPGCFAEYVAVPETNVYAMDRGISPEVAAIQDPFGNAVHTTLSGEITGLTVAVVGSGPIGCCAVAVARAAGAQTVFATDIRPFRLDLARRMGADRVIDSTKEDPVAVVKGETGGQGADVVLEMSGHVEGVKQSFKMLRRGGRLSLLGIPSQPVTLDLAEDVIFKGVDRARHQRPADLEDLVPGPGPAALGEGRPHPAHHPHLPVERDPQGDGAAQGRPGRQDHPLPVQPLPVQLDQEGGAAQRWRPVGVWSEARRRRRRRSPPADTSA